MAISRCHNCGKPTKNVKKKYVAFVYPIGFPDIAAICGKKNGCCCPGLIWLTQQEYSQYQKGNRIFDFATSTTKVKVV